MNLDEIRIEIDNINDQMLNLFKRRMELSRKVIEYKLEHNMPILNKKREADIIEKYGAGDQFSIQFFKSIMEISRNFQTRIMLNKNIVLIGMMGCGKTTIGKILSQQLALDFYDVDSEIEKTAGMSIPKIFEQGEDAFRKLESREVERIAEISNSVISTGGGVILNEKNMHHLKENGIIVFLNRPVQAIISDISLKDRPMLKNDIDKVSQIFNERLSLYQKYADFEIKSVKSPQEVSNDIISLLQNQVLF